MRSLARGAQTASHQLRHDTATRWLVTVLIGLNLAAIIMPLGMELSGQKVPRHLDLMSDKSLPEALNYAQTLACAIFLAMRWPRERRAILLALAATFAAICVDDAFQYHERVGGLLARTLALPALPGLRPQDTGEIFAMSFLGLIFVPWVIRSLQQPGALDSGAAPLLVACLAVFACCGAGLDMLHVATDSQVVGYLEDGGEMLAMAAACSIAFGFLRPIAMSRDAVAVAHQ